VSVIIVFKGLNYYLEMKKVYKI